MKEVKIVTFSDTHNFHEVVEIPPCDILIFAGDYSSRGSKRDTELFLEWFTSQDQAVHKILIPGNHDLSFDPKFNDETSAHHWLQVLLIKYREKFHYLENMSLELLGLKFWGSPITPDFYPEHWAFNMPRGEKINKIWTSIPNNTDVIITHGPCAFIGDYIPSQKLHVGCEDLYRRIEVLKPKLFVCGHIHEGYSKMIKNGTTFVNSSICNERYIPVNKPHEIIITL